LKLEQLFSANIVMEEINQIKLHLKKLIKKTDTSATTPVRIFEEDGQYYLILKKSSKKSSYLSAESMDGLNNKKITYYGDRQIFVSGKKNPVISSALPTEVGGVFLFPEGIIVLYFEKTVDNGIIYYKAYLAEFDKKHPDKMLWKTEKPIWSSQDHWQKKEVAPLGAVMVKNKIVMYWYVNRQIIYGVYLSSFFINPKNITKPVSKLRRHVKNPIIAPRRQNDWESFTTLNPAAAYIDNKVHILYRAQGYDYISTVGYAVSSDGLHIEQRLNKPVYGPTEDFEINKTGRVNRELMSAGGYGGCEDPRITLIDGRVQMVYVAFDGWSNLRLALTSIDVNDFLNQRWNWEKPVLISPPHIIDKSGCLFPEKINGQYVFLHRVFPNILVDFVDDLNFKNNWLSGKYSIDVRPDKWDSRKIGAGAPPIKTKDGWLLIYYGVDDNDAGKYHIGAMLLDLHDPTKVLHRTNEPILSPKEDYENHGFKPGIAYPCGAVVIRDRLLVYYGAADSVVCVAQANLDQFLEELKTENQTHLFPVEIKEVLY
jgi:beta-1,2-mannobiose phosphorylase / 1,2-beta-oligomannan phosphorylase